MADPRGDANVAQNVQHAVNELLRKDTIFVLREMPQDEIHRWSRFKFVERLVDVRQHINSMYTTIRKTWLEKNLAAISLVQCAHVLETNGNTFISVEFTGCK
jgi:hypothetical protein